MIDPQLIALAIEALQRQEYADEKEWFFDVQTVDQLVEFLEDMAADGEMIA
jgi:hypothetical protein